MCMEFIAYSNKIISIKVALFDKSARCLHCSYCVPKTIVKTHFYIKTDKCQNSINAI